MSGILNMWTVYDHPTDYPDFFVARRHEVTAQGSVPTREIMLAKGLGELRAELFARGLTVLTRDRDDDARIVEVWL